MSRKKKSQREPTFPFGKHKGKTLLTVMHEEPSYLCWFADTVEGCEDVKKAIVALPGFEGEQAKYCERQRLREARLRQMVEETVLRILQPGQPAGPEPLDRLCDRLFNEPEAECVAKLKIIKAVHYGKYIQSGENLICEMAGHERYRFQAREDGRKYKPWTVTPATDLTDVPMNILEHMDAEMYYCGETDERDAKFSETRKHIQRTIRGREGRLPF